MAKSAEHKLRDANASALRMWRLLCDIRARINTSRTGYQGGRDVMISHTLTKRIEATIDAENRRYDESVS